MGSRGQSALEYLMTYGFALVVIAIVIAALVFLLGQSVAVQNCSMSPAAGAISYVDHSVSLDGFLTIKLRNDTGRTIENINFEFEDDFDGLTASQINLARSTQEFVIITDNNLNFSQGNYNGKIKINYQTNTINHTTTANCTGIVSQTIKGDFVIIEEDLGEIINLAVEKTNFTASQTDFGNPENLAETEPLSGIWQVNEGGENLSIWIRYDMGESEKINGYELTFSGSDDTRTPKKWEFQGSNDPETNFVSLNIQENITDWVSEETKIFELNEVAEYRYFRILILESNHESRTSLARIRIMGFDNESNQSEPETDTVPPTVNLITFDNNKYFLNDQITLEYFASDNNDISNCDLIIDGITLDQNFNIINNSANYFNINSNDFGVGSYDWNIVCTDYSSNTSTNVGRTFFIFTKPISKWNFNEGQGTVAMDLVGDNNGSINSANWVQGISNSALEFDGSTSYVSIDNSVDLNPTNELTLMAWVKWNIDPSLGNVWTTIINKGNDNQYRLQHNVDNEFFEFGLRNPTSRFVFSTTSPIEGEWYFVVGTYDGSSLKIYVDAENENTLNSTGIISTTNNDLRIASTSNNNRHFNGIIDEVAIYDVALTQEEIQLIFEYYTN